MKICPHLGMKHDAKTPVGYPSTWNVCHHSKKQEIPSLLYQKSTCLGGRFENCPLYESEDPISMPRSIRHRQKFSFNFPWTIKKLALIFILLISIGGLAFSYGYWAPKVSQMLVPSWQKTQQILETKPLEATTMPRITEETAIKTSTPTQTPAVTATSEPTGTPTASQTPPILALDTPIGDEIQFVIHRTLPGESLFLYANQYDTNVDAIRAVNNNLPSVLYVDVIVVIPIGVDDPAGLPQFSAYQVTMRGRTIEALSEELSTDPQTLSKYNNLPMDYIFNPGDWILVPRD